MDPKFLDTAYGVVILYILILLKKV